MNELLFSNQANGDKEMSTNDYDRSREVHAAQSGVTRMSTRTLATELCCPICLDLLTTTMTTKECLHRFCADCITTALLRGNKECPTCRKKLVSKRSLRADPNFDMLISKIWPDRQLYEKMQSKAMETFTMKNNTDSLRTSIEEGMKAQAASRRQRVAGSYDLERSGNTTTTTTTGASRKRKRGEEGGEMDEVVDGNGTPPDEMEDGEQLDGVATQNSATPSSASSEDDDEWRKEEWASLIPADDDLDNTAVMATYMAVDVSADDSADDSDSDSSSGSSSSSSHSSLASSSHMSSITLEPSPEPIVAPPVVAPSPPMPAFENIQPPGEVCTLKDRMHKWLSDNPSTPPMEDQLHEQLERRFNTDDEMDEQSQGSAGDEEWTEIECELIPAACLSRRNPPAALLTPRYFKTRLDTTMDHLTEFIRQCVEEETPDEKCPPADHFYVFSRHGGHHMRRIFSHETMQVAQCAMTKDDHLIIFYDTEPSDLRIQHSLLENIVPAEFLSQPIV